MLTVLFHGESIMISYFIFYFILLYFSYFILLQTVFPSLFNLKD